jgi:hypothetical protein
MIEVNAATEIDASAEAVWSVLTDLNSFKAWNPFIRDARGTTDVGGSVRVRVRPSVGIPLVFHAKVLSREDNHELRWTGHVFSPWLARGDHTFTIEALGKDRVRFVQRETFSGLLPWLAKRLLAREARRGFDAMNQALGARVHEREGRQ